MYRHTYMHAKLPWGRHSAWRWGRCRQTFRSATWCGPNSWTKGREEGTLPYSMPPQGPRASQRSCCCTYALVTVCICLSNGVHMPSLMHAYTMNIRIHISCLRVRRWHHAWEHTHALPSRHLLEAMLQLSVCAEAWKHTQQVHVLTKTHKIQQHQLTYMSTYMYV